MELLRELGGEIARDGKRWVSYRPELLTSVPPAVPGEAHRSTQQLQFFGNHTPLADGQAFAAYLAPLRKTEWVVYSKRPFGGPTDHLFPAIPPRRHRQ